MKGLLDQSKFLSWCGSNSLTEARASIRWRLARNFQLRCHHRTQSSPQTSAAARSVTTTARDQSSGSEAQIALNVPNGWRAEPAHESVEIPKDESKDASFQVFPAKLEESQTHIRAELTSGKKAYGEGYTVVTREDLGAFYYYQPAVQRVSRSWM